MSKNEGLEKDKHTIVLKFWYDKSKLIMFSLILNSDELNMINSVP